MFLSGMLLWLIEHGWVMLLSLVPQSAFPKPLSPEEEARLIREMRDGGESARVKLIEHNLRLVAHIAKKYAQSRRGSGGSGVDRFNWTDEGDCHFSAGGREADYLRRALHRE